jgi:hypothetical protein
MIAPGRTPRNELIKGKLSVAVVLLGDACHPTTPYMAQGHCYVYGRRGNSRPLPRPNRRRWHRGGVQAVRGHLKPRTSVIQAISNANTWMRDAAGGDPHWLYGYDA